MKNKDFSDISLLWYFLSNPTQVQKYFLEMKSKMPSLSPIDKNWPSRPYLFLDSTHKELKRIFHLWRVKSRFFLETSHRVFILCVCEESRGSECLPPLLWPGGTCLRTGVFLRRGPRVASVRSPGAAGVPLGLPLSSEGVCVAMSSFPFRFHLP